MVVDELSVTLHGLSSELYRFDVINFRSIGRKEIVSAYPALPFLLPQQLGSSGV